MTKKEIALNYLKRDILKNCDLITFFDICDDIEIIYSNDDGVCFNIKSTNIYCVSTDKELVSQKCANLLNNVSNCICKNEWDFRVFNEKFNFKNVDECYQYIYKINPNFVSSNFVKKLTTNYIDEMKEKFSICVSKDDIKNLMSKFNFYGYFLENMLVGIVGRHIDGEIGFLEVLEDYRKRGIATELLNTIINENNNIIPYSQVLINNEKSIKLQEKLGATKNPTTVFWCYKENS